MEILEYFFKGGSVMYVLLLCSICVIAILVERGRFYRQAAAGMENFVEQLPALIGGKDWQTAYEQCAEQQCAAAFITKAGLQAAAEGKDAELALATAYNNAAAELRSGMNYLSMIVTLSPLLGLLGTIAGMISSFNVFSLQAGQPMAITGGIGEALIATATGLCVAIFALVVHSFFAQKMDKVLTSMDNAEAIVTTELRKRG